LGIPGEDKQELYIPAFLRYADHPSIRRPPMPKRKPAEQYQVPELETTAQPQPDPHDLAKANEQFPLPELEAATPRQ
jgi:hypothetical protein